MQKRYCAIWFRYLLTDWLAIRKPELKDVPFVLAASEKNRIIIKAANQLAEKQGIIPGSTAADAKAVIPDLKVFDFIPGKAEKLLAAIGEWCIRYTPLIAVDAPDGLLLDISGCTHLWGGEKGYLQEILKRLKGKGYYVRGAIADTIGAAWAIARFGKEKAIIEPGGQTEALLKLPPAALRLDTAAVDRLHKLGFYTVQQFIGIKRSALRRRFGEQLLLRIDEALGTAAEHLQWIHPLHPYQERLPCLEPIQTATGIEIAIRNLLETLCNRLKSEGKGLRVAILRCYRVDGKLVGADIATGRPSCSVDHLFKLFALKIASIEPALGIELFTLEAPKVEDLMIDQEILWTPEGCGLESPQLAELLDKLANKIGAKNIQRYLPVESYWPERAYKPSLSLSETTTGKWRAGRPRPSLLLKKPERIEVTSLLPDNPPMLFIYKGEKHIIRKAEDAERIEPEWWLTQSPHRDYYLVEDEQGRRYWVFRSGHYDDADSQWYIHGFFA
ncbi:DNA polymerase Y family protein [Mucilaginibacter sp. RS28]|uniref:DNA polymerase Y family protein n=1 Tax=Mucilaginibacter straminoryzae TaxID=2932774 RepID=A0A9X1X6Y3_9SPHI|nr:DNA polymerase Y family protein [Mucilaginibacter straminoryzae]MCJ8209749.1 DNA polymerase Y family protein [Mucilaginibacter straminoryzae]